MVTAVVRRRDRSAAAKLVPRFDRGTSARLLVGPTNTAGQARLWARAAETHLDGVAARNMVAERNGRIGGFGYEADVIVPSRLQSHGLPAWGTGVLDTFSHLLLEAGRGVTAEFFATASNDLLAQYAAADVRVAVILHGSEIRDHARHAALYSASPFNERSDYLNRVQARVDETRAFLERTDLPLLVSTLDLIDFVAGAKWLPVTADVDRFATAAVESAAPLGRDLPVVLHAPSNPFLKGTAAIEEIALQLHAEGRLVYRRLEGVPHAEMPAFIADADIVIDQIVLGNVGTLAAESMAAGRLVIGHLHERVRQRWREMGGGEIPLIEATPDTLENVLTTILADRERYAAVAATGPAWARKHHDGRASAAALAPFLGVDPPR